MKIEPKTVLASAAAGAGAYAGYVWLRPDVVTGAPTQPNEARLRQGAGVGREFAVEGGVLAWDNRWDRWAEQNDGWIRDNYGRRARIGTPDASFMVYGLAVELLEQSNRFARIFMRLVRPAALRTMYEGYLDSQEYNLSSLNDGELAVLTHYVNSSIQAATALRVLSRCYRAAGMQPHTSPTRYKQRLTTITVGGEINPLANHEVSPPAKVGYTVEGRNGWETFGMTAMDAYTTAYPSLTSRLLDDRDREAIREDAEDTQTGLASEPTMQGAFLVALLPYLGRIIIMLIGLGIVVVLRKPLNAIVLGLFGNQEYQQILTERYERLSDRCDDGDRDACAQLPALAAEIRSFRMGWLKKSLMWGLIISVVGGVGYIGYRLVFGARRRQARIATRAIKRLSA